MSTYRCGRHGSYSVPDGLAIAQIHCPDCAEEDNRSRDHDLLEELSAQEVIRYCLDCRRVTLHRPVEVAMICQRCGGVYYTSWKEAGEEGEHEEDT